LIVTANVVVAVRSRGLKMWPRRWPVSLSTLPVLGVAACALVVVTLAAYLLPVWQWDALGYHLPYVNFALQRGTFADIPVDVAYVSTYPHVVEHVFIAWRALIPDDRLVELANLPFGLLGATAVGVIAYRQGARASTTVAAGAVWLTLPAVFLQLPTNYVDVASAAQLLTAIAFVLRSVDCTRVILSAIALGMFLGSNRVRHGRSAGIRRLAVAAWRSGLRGTIGIAAVVVLLLGGESYLTNLVRQGNPVWPVRVDLGPIHLPGRFPMSDLLASGAGAPRAQGSLATRVFDSWTTMWPAVPAFDMRVGGLGVLILVALPFALIRVVRQRSVVLVLVFVATLATPDPAWRGCAGVRRVGAGVRGAHDRPPASREVRPRLSACPRRTGCGAQRVRRLPGFDRRGPAVARLCRHVRLRASACGRGRRCPDTVSRCGRPRGSW
jgi:hypothetical protein